MIKLIKRKIKNKIPSMGIALLATYSISKNIRLKDEILIYINSSYKKMVVQVTWWNEDIIVLLKNNNFHWISQNRRKEAKWKEG